MPRPPFHLNKEANREKNVPPSYFYPYVSRGGVHTPTAILLETGPLLIWFGLSVVAAVIVVVVVSFLMRVCCGIGKLQRMRQPGRTEPGRTEPSLACWPWRTTSWQQISSCIDFYFRGWVIWVAALQPQLGWPPRSPGSIWESVIIFIAFFFFAIRVDIGALSGSLSAATYTSS